MRSSVTVDNVDAYAAAGAAGLGIIQVPRHGQNQTTEKMVEVMPAYTARPLSISLLHTHGRSVPKRVRAVMNWLTELLMPIVGQLLKTP